MRGPFEPLPLEDARQTQHGRQERHGDDGEEEPRISAGDGRSKGLGQTTLAAVYELQGLVAETEARNDEEDGDLWRPGDDETNEVELD